MKKETWTLPDGSEIRIEHEEQASVIDLGDGARIINTWDPEIVAAAESAKRSDESLDQAFERLVIEGLENVEEERDDTWLDLDGWKREYEEGGD